MRILLGTTFSGEEETFIGLGEEDLGRVTGNQFQQRLKEGI
jgi:hypothetical protein